MANLPEVDRELLEQDLMEITRRIEEGEYLDTEELKELIKMGTKILFKLEMKQF